MKVLGIMGSPRIGGNSDILLEQTLTGAKDAGAEVEKIILCRKKISGCLNCEKCNKTGICAIRDDMPEIHAKILQADNVIHSGPIYFWTLTAQIKAYLDRWCVFFDANWDWHKKYASIMKKKKIGVIVVCGDPNLKTADPMIHVFKKTCEFGNKLIWLGAVRASADVKGEIAKNGKAKKQAYNLGKKGASL